jgi:hypothetical protein
MTRAPPGPPMTLANMRQNGVRSVTAACANCGRSAAANVDLLPETLTVPEAGKQRMRREADLDPPRMAHGPAPWHTRPPSLRRIIVPDNPPPEIETLIDAHTDAFNTQNVRALPSRFHGFARSSAAFSQRGPFLPARAARAVFIALAASFLFGTLGRRSRRNTARASCAGWRIDS